jgi:hypothetical protein
LTDRWISHASPVQRAVAGVQAARTTPFVDIGWESFAPDICACAGHAASSCDIERLHIKQIGGV